MKTKQKNRLSLSGIGKITVGVTESYFFVLSLIHAIYSTENTFFVHVRQNERIFCRIDSMCK